MTPRLRLTYGLARKPYVRRLEGTYEELKAESDAAWEISSITGLTQSSFEYPAQDD